MVQLERHQTVRACPARQLHFVQALETLPLRVFAALASSAQVGQSQHPHRTILQASHACQATTVLLVPQRHSHAQLVCTATAHQGTRVGTAEKGIIVSAAAGRRPHAVIPIPYGALLVTCARKGTGAPLARLCPLHALLEHLAPSTLQSHKMPALLVLLVSLARPPIWLLPLLLAQLDTTALVVTPHPPRCARSVAFALLGRKNHCLVLREHLQTQLVPSPAPCARMDHIVLLRAWNLLIALLDITALKALGLASNIPALSEPSAALAGSIVLRNAPTVPLVSTATWKD
jgi:hypothetical protein